MMNKHISDLIFIKWLIGVIFFFLFIYLLSYFDFLSSLINNDASYISSLIFIIFFYFSIKVGIELYYLRMRYININLLLSMLLSKSKKDINDILNIFQKSNNHDDQSIYLYITCLLYTSSEPTRPY